jgi:hypothetical protein
MGEGLFLWSSIKEIRIPSSVERIRKDCFFQSKSLHYVVFNSDSRLKGIDGCAFT